MELTNSQLRVLLLLHNPGTQAHFSEGIPPYRGMRRTCWLLPGIATAETVTIKSLVARGLLEEKDNLAIITDKGRAICDEWHRKECECWTGEAECD